MRIPQVLRGSAASLLLVVSAAASASAQTLYNNGPAVDGTGKSAIRAGGTLFGLGAQSTIPNLVADDFSVAGPTWNVTGLSFFAYQTGAQNTFTFTGLTWSIISGNVNSGSVVASGTGAPTNGGLVGYRVTPTTLTNTDRAIFRLDLDVTDFFLGSGSYWLRWGIAGTLASGPWQPPTSDGVAGNAQQSIANAAFSQYADSDQLGVELPFIISGTTSVVPEPSTTALMVLGGVATLVLARRRRNA